MFFQIYIINNLLVYTLSEIPIDFLKTIPLSFDSPIGITIICKSGALKLPL